MKSLADRLEEMAVEGRHDSKILHEALRQEWLSVEHKNVIKRCLYGEEWRTDSLTLVTIANAIRRIEA